MLYREQTAGVPYALYRRPGMLLGIGVLLLALGAIAITVPVATSIGIELALGALLVIAGAAQLVSAFSASDGWGVAAGAALGLVSLVLGGLFLANPLQGIVALALVVAALFFASGAIKLGTAWRMRGMRGWLWGVVSGLASLVIGVLIAIGWPELSALVLGLLFGIDLIFSGITLIALSVASRGTP